MQNAEQAGDLFIYPPAVMIKTKRVLNANPTLVIANGRDEKLHRHKQIVLRAMQSSMSKRGLTDVGKRRRDFVQWLTLNTPSGLT